MSNDNRNKRKMNTEENHPCLKEHMASLKCMDDNDYNKDSCQKYFANYTGCMGFWNNVKVERKRKGITPHLPPVDEREAIVKEYFNPQ